MSDQESWTIGRLLQWTTDYLKKSGAGSPRLDAEVLLSDARGCERIQLYTAYNEDPGETVRSRFRELVKRRAAGEPVAYLVGRREFYSLMFHVTRDVLIPRPETEFVVLGVLDAIEALAVVDRPVLVADVGTGSGAIAVSIARHAPGARITAVDLSPQALEVARQNAERHGLLDQIELVMSDLLDGVVSPARFDVIASNPPYIAEAEWPTLSRDVRDFEPRQALLGGPEGMDVIARLIAQAAQRLVRGGWLFLEISPLIENKVRALLHPESGWCAVDVVKDMAGLPRVVKARLDGDTLNA